MKLWLKVLIGLIVGVLFGLLLRLPLLPPGSVENILNTLQMCGNLLMRAIQMLLPLLVFSAMAVGITSIRDLKKLGRVGTHIFILFIGTTVIAIVIGFAFGELMQPGKEMNLIGQRLLNSTEGRLTLGEMLFNIVPANPMEALAQGNTLQILFFALMMGLAINVAGEKAEPLSDFFHSLAHVMYQLIGMIMQFSPYAVCAIMAWVVGSFGWNILQSLFKFIMAIYLASFAHMFIVYGGILLLVGLRPWPFFRGMKEAILFAFSSSSSSATLPTSLVCAQKNLGISAHIANFVLPLGAAINMNGTALFRAISAIFISQAYQISLSPFDYVTIIFVANISSIGTAGAPGSGLVILGTVLASIGLPVEAISILLGIDRLRDMVGTVVNILGDAIVAVYIAKKEGEINEEVYNASGDLLNSDRSSMQ